MVGPDRSETQQQQAAPLRGWPSLSGQALLSWLIGASTFVAAPVIAAPVEITSGNTIYTLDVTQCFAPGTDFNCVGAADFRNSSWFGNAALSKTLSEATKAALGLPNQDSFSNMGPLFVFSSETSPPYNATSLPFDSYWWDPNVDVSYPRSGRWNSAIGEGDSTIFTRTSVIATETQAPRPAVATPILAANNGSSTNTTASLLANTLLPQFQGGTLTVSASGAFTPDFTLDGSSTNAIDANGNDATFGVFSDQAGSTGSITFKNSAASRATLTLSGSSTYSGPTYIDTNTSLVLGIDNALPQVELVAIYGSGKLDLNSNNQTIGALGGDGAVSLGSGTLTIDSSAYPVSNSGAEFSGTGGLIKTGPFTQVLSGALAYTGATRVKSGTLVINGTSTSETTVDAGATLAGTGSVTGNVSNSGTLSPGNSIGTFTINGDYTQTASGTLALEVGAGGTGDLLQINSGRVSDLAGQVLISSASGTSITPGVTYTGIATNPGVKYTGASIANAAFGAIVGDAGYVFVREDDARFSELNNGTAIKDSTKLQFGWLQVKPSVEGPKAEPQVVLPNKTLTGIDTIDEVRQQGGAITQVVSAPLSTVREACRANTGSDSNCAKQIGTSTESGPTKVSANSLRVARTFDAGKASIDSGAQPIVAVNPATQQQQILAPNANKEQKLTTSQKPVVSSYGNGSYKFTVNSDGTTQVAVVSKKPEIVANSDGTHTTTFAASGGQEVKSDSGQATGLNTVQLNLAGVNKDFLNVYSALFSVPTRSELNQALHSITAELYASMQSVALEAMEQFRFNALALSRGDKAIRLFTDAEVCRLDDGTLIPASSEQQPTDCKPRKISQASRWSLLIDATNTQASLNGTNDLASLDYNIFQSTYGLQYDASRQWSIGAAFGYGQANLYNYEYASSTINSNTYGGGLWGIYRPGDAWKITGLLGYMNLQYDSSRNINFGGINRNAWANWSGNGFTTAIDVQYDWVLSGNKADRNAVRIKPNTYLSYSLHNQGDITESGADSLNLAINGHTADSLIYGLGLTLETPVQLTRSTRLIPRLSVGYEYDFNGDSNEEHQLTASFAEVPALGSLDVLGQNRGANDLTVGLSVELETSEQFSLYAGVGGSFWSNGNELNYGGGLRWRFGGAPKATVAKAAVTEPGQSVAPVPGQQPAVKGLW